MSLKMFATIQMLVDHPLWWCVAIIFFRKRLVEGDFAKRQKIHSLSTSSDRSSSASKKWLEGWRIIRSLS